MGTISLSDFLGWEAISPGRKRTTCPRCETAIELRLMDDILEVACPGCGHGPFFELAQNYEHEHGSSATVAALQHLGVLSAEELTQALEAAGPPAPGAEEQRDVVAAARALGFFQKSLYFAHAPGESDQLLLKPLRELVGSGQLLEAVEIERREGRPVGEVIAELTLSAEKDKLRADLEEQEVLDLDTVVIPDAVRDAIPAGIASSFLAIPLRIENDVIVVATADALDFQVVDDLKFHLGTEIRTVTATEASLFRALERLYPEALEAEAQEPIDEELHLLSDQLGAGETGVDAEEADSRPPDIPSEAPGARTLSALLLQATEERADQLVLEALDIYYRVRLRRGGRLRDCARLPRPVGEAVIEQGMMQAGMDLSRRNQPQTGVIRTMIAGETVDFEAAVAPTVFGLTLAFTVRETTFRLLPLEGLALVPGDSQLLRGILQIPPGLTVIASPRGGGRTTLLYSLLRESDRAREHVVTLERATSARVEGTSQLSESNYVRLASVLQHLQPDRIFIDDLPSCVGTAHAREEVELALDLALRDARVVVAVAAPTALAAVGRLAATGVDSNLLFSVMRGLIGIRLVKRVCQRCREDFDASKELARELGLPDQESSRRISIGIGCWECGGRGYRGRSALIEVAPLTDPALRSAARQLDPAGFAAAARAAGIRLLPDKALAALRSGLTSVSQIEDLVATA